MLSLIQAFVTAGSAVGVAAALTSGPSPSSPPTTTLSGTFSEALCNGSSCDLSAGSTPTTPSDSPAPAAAPGQLPRLVCHFTPDPGFSPPATMSPSDSHVGEAGSWMLRQCPGNAVDVMGRAPMPTVGDVVWAPTRALATPADLAEVAYKQLKPPDLTLVLSPPNTRPELVGLPLWLSVPASSWVPVTASAAAAGASVTATAKPVSVTWSMGDGGSVTCHGPGTAYPSDPSVHPPLSSPTCGYEYLRAGRSFPVTATVDWQVAWSGTGNSGGSLPDLHSLSATQVQVTEVQALVTGVSS